MDWMLELKADCRLVSSPDRHVPGNQDRVAERVTRGGAADTGPETLRTTWRGASVSRRSTAGHHNIGFRCAKDAE